MRRTEQILSELEARDVRLWVEGDRLRLSAPKGALTEDLREELTSRKAEILSYFEVARRETERSVRIAPRSSNAGVDLPLSFGQERLWFLHLLEADSTAYNIPMEIRLRGPADVSALESALTELTRRHEVLRTIFMEVEGVPVQRVLPVEPIRLELRDLTGLTAEAFDLEYERARRENGRARFDMDERPPWRTLVLKTAPEEHLLLLTQHHILTDRWSIAVLVRELELLYRGFSEGRVAALPPLSIQYADFARWQRQRVESDALSRDLDFWRAQLAPPFPVVSLPLDAPRSDVQTFRGAWETVVLPGSLLDALKALARSENATLFMVLLAAFDVLIYRYTGLLDVLVGTPTAGRMERETEALMGFFVNTLVLRSDLSGNPSFRELLRRVRRVSLDAFTHQACPFEKIVESVPIERRLNLNPFFQLMLVLQNTPPVEREEAGDSSITFTATGGSTLDLTLYHVDRGRDLVLTAEYNTDLFQRETVLGYLSNFQRLLEDVAARPDVELGELDVIAPAEREKLSREWNQTSRAFDRELRLHDLFEAQVARTPDATAVISEDEALTYRELDARAARLAARLAEAGIGVEARVGLCLPRSVDLVAGILGVMKSGAAYVPLDPAYPEERLALMLRDSGAKAVVTAAEAREKLPELDISLFDLADIFEGASGATHPDAPGEVSSENLAYVLYTSGSTGTPKGVAITHRSAVALLRWAGETFGDEEVSHVGFATSICFDLSLFELFLPLSRGGRVIVLENALAVPRSTPARSVRLLNTVPSAMAELVRSGSVPSSVRTICLAGEPLSRDLVREIYESTSVERVFDLYGPSEDTTYSTFALRTADGPATIGRPIANTEIYVVNPELELVPRGAVGELVIGGDGLARGYLDRPAETAEKFVPDPFSRRPGSRLYRTGDLARHLSDGRLEFLGRRDHQVKLRGFRIELPEIEARLREHESIDSAAVIVRGVGPEAQLEAYLACGVGEQPTVTELRRFLRAKLPAHMVPSTFVLLDALPLTPNGKVNRRALDDLDSEPVRGEHYVAPRTETEKAIARVWSSLLSVDRVGALDNFFDLGGHSLLSVRAIAGIEKETGVRLGVRDLMFQTLEQCATACEHGLARRRAT